MRVLGLMKLLMRNAICLRLLSPLPIACAPLPRLLLCGFFHRVQRLVEMERRETRWKRWWVFNLFNIYMSYSGLTRSLSIWNCLWPNQPPSRTSDSVYHIRTCSVADPVGWLAIWGIHVPKLWRKPEMDQYWHFCLNFAQVCLNFDLKETLCPWFKLMLFFYTVN